MIMLPSLNLCLAYLITQKQNALKICLPRLKVNFSASVKGNYSKYMWHVPDIKEFCLTQ